MLKSEQNRLEKKYFFFSYFNVVFKRMPNRLKIVARFILNQVKVSVGAPNLSTTPYRTVPFSVRDRLGRPHSVPYFLSVFRDFNLKARTLP